MQLIRQLHGYKYLKIKRFNSDNLGNTKNKLSF